MKLLKISFVILLLVTLGELGYYGYTLNRDDLSTKLANSQTEARDSESILSQVQNKPKQETLVDSNIISYLLSRPKNDAQRFYVLGEEKGYIGDIIYEKTGVNVQINIVDKKGTKVVYLSTPIKEMDLTLFKMVNGEKKAIKLSDIKVGDQIVHNFKIDLSDQDKPSENEFLIY